MSRSILRFSFSNSAGSVAIVTLFLFFTCFVKGFAAVEAVELKVFAVDVEKEALDVANVIFEVATETVGGTVTRGEGIGGPSQLNIGVEDGITADCVDDEGTNVFAEVFNVDVVAVLVGIVAVTEQGAPDEDNVVLREVNAKDSGTGTREG